eukprot:gene14285-10210_t
MGAVFLDKSKILEAAGVPPDVVTQAARLRSMMTAPSIDKVVRQTVRRLRSAAGRRAHTSSVHSLPSMTKLKKVAKELGIAEASLTNKGVINLSFLLDVLMGDLKALDWETFAENERVQPLRIIASLREGATHCIVLRSRPEPCHVLGKGPGVYEQLIARRFFHQYNATDAVDWMMSLQHQRIYAEDVLLMNEAAAGPLDGVQFEDRSVHLLPIAVGAEHRNNEIGQLETRREKIYDGLRQGARRVLEVFVPLLLTLETLPAALAPPLVARLQGYRASINSEDSFVDATE